MDRWGLYFNNISNHLVHSPTGQFLSVMREGAHPFIMWNPLINCHYSTSELRQLHRRFGHPDTDRLLQLLQKADIDHVTEQTRATLEKIVRSCKFCQIFAARPRRFKFTLRDDAQFKSTIYVDLFWIDKKTVLHVVDEATRYQAARWVPSVSAGKIWEALRLCWIDVYIGPPDVIAHDPGKFFLAESFQQIADLFSIRTKSIPVEAANSMSTVERYHDLVRGAYHIVKKECPDSFDELALQMAVKAVNDSVGPDEINPALAVYGAIPRLGLLRDRPSLSTHQRAIAVKKATQALTKHFSSCQVRDALRARNGPNVTDSLSAPMGSRAGVPS